MKCIAVFAATSLAVVDEARALLAPRELTKIAAAKTPTPTPPADAAKQLEQLTAKLSKEGDKVEATVGDVRKVPVGDKVPEAAVTTVGPPPQVNQDTYAYGEECRDQKPECAEWAEQDNCSNPIAEKFMHDHCRQSCGKCPIIECLDNNKLCPSWKAYCTKETHQQFMQQNCRKSCGTCPVDKVSAASVAAASVVKAPANIVV